jgi:phosphoserine phosphatase RsbX
VNVLTAHISTPKPGEVVNGDALLVREDLSGRVLLAVIDGLGHGRKAADASQAALGRLNEVPLDQPLLDTLKLVHQDLRGTRGAAATVCLLTPRRLEACAVGNVQLSSAGFTLPLVLSAGVLGHQVGTFRICQVDAPERYRLMLYSDGISTRVRWGELVNLPPAAVCEAVYAQYRRAEDDATILVADVNG